VLKHNPWHVGLVGQAVEVVINKLGGGWEQGGPTVK
jgi:hypothetical protein